MKEKVPPNFEKYGSSVGDKGLARIELAGINGRTAIKALRTRSPLLVQKALYPDSHAPEMAHIILMSSSGGILSGDRFDIQIVAGQGTAARVTTQAATKIYKMERGYAAQTVNISAQQKSYLEFLPHQIIPFKSSRFLQRVEVKADQSATVLYSETVSAGRTASGEDFDFEVCFLGMSMTDLGGKVLFADAAKLEPGKEEIKWLFGGKNIWSTLYVVTHDFDDLKKQADGLIEKHKILAGTSVLPHDCGFIIRMLDNSIDRVRVLTEGVATSCRQHILSQVVVSENS